MERDQEDAEWARKVKARDHYACVICNSSGVYLEAHHLNCYSKYPDERLDLDNGETICKYHHDMFHKIYGKEHTTRFQFDQYKKTIETLQSIIKKS